MVMPTVASIPTAEIAMPYSPAERWATKMAAQIIRTDGTALFNPTASPAMMFVAGAPRGAPGVTRVGAAGGENSVRRAVANPGRGPRPTPPNKAHAGGGGGAGGGGCGWTACVIV